MIEQRNTTEIITLPQLHWMEVKIIQLTLDLSPFTDILKPLRLVSFNNVFILRPFEI